jgi:hypothetical protein
LFQWASVSFDCIFQTWSTTESFICERFPFVCFLRLVDESPRWLFAQGRYKEAEAIVKKTLTRNNKSHLISADGISVDQLRLALTSSATADEWPAATAEVEKTAIEHKISTLDLFRTPRLRSRTFNIGLNW